jgi:hypothetical protein
VDSDGTGSEQCKKHGAKVELAGNSIFRVRSRIARRTFSENESEDERKFAAETEQQFTQAFADVRPRFEKVFDEGAERPKSADELLTHLNGEGGAFWVMAANLYERAAKWVPQKSRYVLLWKVARLSTL